MGWGEIEWNGMGWGPEQLDTRRRRHCPPLPFDQPMLRAIREAFNDLGVVNMMGTVAVASCLDRRLNRRARRRLRHPLPKNIDVRVRANRAGYPGPGKGKEMKNRKKNRPNRTRRRPSDGVFCPDLTRRAWWHDRRLSNFVNDG
jgi:hypothetical protein